MNQLSGLRVSIVIYLVTVPITVTGNSCPKPCLYFTYGSTIQRLPLTYNGGIPNTPRLQIIISGGKNFEGIDMNQELSKLYFTDIPLRRIFSSNLNGSQPKLLVKHILVSPHGIGVDWLSKNIYWTDRTQNWIGVATFDGNHVKILISGNMEQPRGIAVNARDGYLYWTVWGRRPSIERAQLNGQGRQVIVSSGLRWPHDFALDYNNNRLYWIDAFTSLLESTDFNGGQRSSHRSLSQSQSSIPYALAFYQPYNKFYYTDWNVNKIMKFTKGQSQPPAPFVNGGISSRFHGIEVDYSARQPTGYNPCGSNNGGCSHLCLKSSARTFSCDCQTGSILNADGKRCNSIQPQNVLFAIDASTKKLYQISKYNYQKGVKFTQIPVPPSAMMNPVAVTVNDKTSTIFWSDVAIHKIFKMDLNGNNFQEIITTSINISDGLAFDNVGQLLYWSDDQLDKIEVCKLDGSERKTLISQGLDHPRDIFLYQKKGIMFFSDWGNHPKIEKANMDGTGRSVIVSTSLQWPNGIAVDAIEDRLYWTDAYLDKIEYSNLDGSDRRILIDDHIYVPSTSVFSKRYDSAVQHPFALVLYKDKICWTDWKIKGVLCANKYSGGEIDYVALDLGRPAGLHISTPNITNDKKLEYRFSYGTTSASVNPSCFVKSICTPAITKQPPPCPAGYKSTRLGSTCSNCSHPLGKNLRCRCDDWMSCAHRWSSSHYCPRSRPFMQFMVRECVQVIRAGYCPRYICTSGSPSKNDCLSDEDCTTSNHKCCSTSCGKRCITKSIKSDLHPCQINNGNCSHLCLLNPNGFRCSCPDNMLMRSNGKACYRINGNSAVSMIFQLTTGQELHVDDIRIVLANACTSYCQSHSCLAHVPPTEVRNEVVRRRRGTQSPIKFTAIDIFVLQGYPKKLSSTRSEVQYTVLFPAVYNQTNNGVLEIQSARHALESFKENISERLGIIFLESKIIELKQIKNNPEEPRKTSVWIYVVPSLVAALLVFAVVFYKKRSILVVCFGPPKQPRGNQQCEFNNPAFDPGADYADPFFNQRCHRVVNGSLIRDLHCDVLAYDPRNQKNQDQQEPSIASERQIPQLVNQSYETSDGITNAPPNQPSYESIKEEPIYEEPLKILQDLYTNNGLGPVAERPRQSSEYMHLQIDEVTSPTYQPFSSIVVSSSPQTEQMINNPCYVTRQLEEDEPYVSMV